MAEPTSEPRALTAALAAPAFMTKGGHLAMHAATRHVERWAPEAGADRVRSLRNLGFVDRLVAPWVEAAQRSASLRLFSQYHSSGMPDRAVNQTSWVFPRPWYQDELDWMAAARQTSTQVAMGSSAPSMLTTRGTYVAPQAAPSAMAMPSALYEFVAPSLSIAPPQRGDMSMTPMASAERGSGRDTYSSLVPLAAVHAAQVMQRAITPIIGAGPGAVTRMSPGLRAVLTSMLERTAANAYGASQGATPTRLAAFAPELVTPPAPRAAEAVESSPSAPSIDAPTPPTPTPTPTPMSRVVADLSAQRTQLAELQRAARVMAERELAVRAASTAQAQAPRTVAQPQPQPQPHSDQAQVEARIAERLAERQREQATTANQAAIDRATAERVQIAERAQIAERVSHAQREQRLHEGARESAARDARDAFAAASSANVAARAAASITESGTAASSSTPTAARVPHELVQAMAALSPALASTIATSIAQHPERAAQTIGELGEALRTVELLARTSAAGGSFESARGPRLVMPAGLGGLVATVERATPVSATRAARAMYTPTLDTDGVSAPLASGSARAHAPARTSARSFAHADLRIPAMAWLESSGRVAGSVTPAALAAAETSAPAALHHVAWADRWLARFSGARAQSLGMLVAASASPETRLQALAAAAPGTVFVAPEFDAATSSTSAQPAAAAATVAPITRYDDDAETPDDVFASIAAAARDVRSTPTTRARAAAELAPDARAIHAGIDRETFADVLAHAAPSAPGAGLSSQLAASPFAPAFRHMLPLAAASTFDVRALFGENLAASYLAGLLAPSTHEVAIGSHGPTWLRAFSGEIGAGSPALGDLGELGGAPGAMRAALEWEPAYVAPADEATAEGAGLATTSAQLIEAQAAVERLTTMRSALLAWDVETPYAPAGSFEARSEQARVLGAPSVAQGPSMARSMVEAMSLPMIGEQATVRDAVGSIDAGGGSGMTYGASFAAPGMIADRAHAWSVAQERSASDLSFDFVTPELVLAARVYGLGPAAAAQAARLAVAGPGQLAAMASTVDRTFVQALAIEAERRDRMQTVGAITAYPRHRDDAATTAASPSSPSSTTSTTAGAMPAASTGTTFGVERRTPRGAYMWPAGTIAALGLTAASPDGQQSMSIAALELLAAQSVAELGTYAAFGYEHPSVAGDDTSASSSSAATIAASASTATAALSPTDAIRSAQASSEPSEMDVVATAAAMVPTSRRSKFEAMYVALAQSQAARGWSPAARAARALALAGRGDETTTAQERAAIAWELLPVVAPSAASGDSTDAIDADLAPGAARSTGAAAQRARAQHAQLLASKIVLPDYVEVRPGLAALSARAGEALGSYVSPSASSASSSSSSSSSSAPSSSSSSSHREPGALRRVPTAAQEMVRTGRPTGRFGGGEVEIPTWFEAAARKMFDDRSGGGPSSDISLAELTLITAAPANQVAASSRSMPSAVPSNPNPSSQGAQANPSQPIDIEKVANEVYRQILVLMDAARFRNGEPYL